MASIFVYGALKRKIVRLRRTKKPNLWDTLRLLGANSSFSDPTRDFSWVILTENTEVWGFGIYPHFELMKFTELDRISFLNLSPNLRGGGGH